MHIDIRRGQFNLVNKGHLHVPVGGHCWAKAMFHFIVEDARTFRHRLSVDSDSQLCTI